MSASSPEPTSVLHRAWIAFLRWFDTGTDAPSEQLSDRIDWVRVIPFIGMHMACLGVIWVGVSPIAVTVAALLYALRMFAITGFYHRYFSHKSFRTSRPMQFCFALIGAMSVQRGPLWWAAHHRHHHRHSDQDKDFHSPVTRSLLWSHMGWFECSIPSERILTDPF